MTSITSITIEITNNSKEGDLTALFDKLSNCEFGTREENLAITNLQLHPEDKTITLDTTREDHAKKLIKFAFAHMTNVETIENKDGSTTTCVDHLNYAITVKKQAPAP